MIAQIRRKLSMATRVLDFSHAHPSTDVGHVALVTRFEALLTRAEALALRERSGTVAERLGVNRRLQFRDAVTRQLRHLVKVAEVAGKKDPTLGGRFVMPRPNGPHRTFLTAAKVMLTEATALEATLVPLGLGETFLAELTAGLNGFEATSEVVHTGRSDHVGARAELTTITAELMDIVALLDGLNHARYKGQPDLRAAWESARNVVGPYRPKQDASEEPGTAIVLG